MDWRKQKNDKTQRGDAGPLLITPTSGNEAPGLCATRHNRAVQEGGNREMLEQSVVPWQSQNVDRSSCKGHIGMNTAA